MGAHAIPKKQHIKLKTLGCQLQLFLKIGPNPQTTMANHFLWALLVQAQSNHLSQTNLFGLPQQLNRVSPLNPREINGTGREGGWPPKTVSLC